jgi:hypothetical protein
LVLINFQASLICSLFNLIGTLCFSSGAGSFLLDNAFFSSLIDYFAFSVA